MTTDDTMLVQLSVAELRSLVCEAVSAARVEDPWLDLESAATQCPVSAHTLRSWCKAGRLQSCTAERGRFIFRRSWLDAAIEGAEYQPRRHVAAEAPDLDAWEAEAVRRLAG